MEPKNMTEPRHINVYDMQRFLIKEISNDRWQTALRRIPLQYQAAPVSVLPQALNPILGAVETSEHPHRVAVVNDLARDLTQLLSAQFQTEQFLGRIATIGDMLQVEEDIELMNATVPAGTRFN